MPRSSLCLLLVLTAAACSCEEGGTGSVKPRLELNDESVDFGLVAVGDRAVQVLRLSAATSAALDLTVRLEDEAGVFALENDPVPTRIDGRGDVDLRLVFTPTADEVYAATLVIGTNDPDTANGNRRILLSGEGKSPQITVLPDHLDLSAIGCPPNAQSSRCTDEDKVVLENTGLVTLTLGTVEIVPKAGGQAVPNLALARLVSTTSLAPGETLEVPVRWKPAPGQAPAGGADYEAVLRVPSNDPEKPVIEVALRARADPNTAPQACIEVTAITRLTYKDDGSGEAIVTPVPESDWFRDDAPGVLQVEPGMTVEFSLDAAPACSFDPEGEEFSSIVWSVPAKPELSRASFPQDGLRTVRLTIDAVGEYGVSVVVRDSLGLTGAAQLAINAIPRDDLFVQLSWSGTDADKSDVDLHLLVDAGGSIPGEAHLFCRQDIFVFNPKWDVFDTPSVTDDPVFLRDDQGSAGRLESVALEAAPAGSRFRVAAHYYRVDQATTRNVTPSLTIRLKGDSFGPFTATSPISAENDVWIGAEIVFPESGTPTATLIDTKTTTEPYTGAVGVCL